MPTDKVPLCDNQRGTFNISSGTFMQRKCHFFFASIIYPQTKRIFHAPLTAAYKTGSGNPCGAQPTQALREDTLCTAHSHAWHGAQSLFARRTAHTSPPHCHAQHGKRRFTRARDSRKIFSYAIHERRETRVGAAAIGFTAKTVGHIETAARS